MHTQIVPQSQKLFTRLANASESHTAFGDCVGKGGRQFPQGCTCVRVCKMDACMRVREQRACVLARIFAMFISPVRACGVSACARVRAAFPVSSTHSNDPVWQKLLSLLARCQSLGRAQRGAEEVPRSGMNISPKPPADSVYLAHDTADIHDANVSQAMAADKLRPPPPPQSCRQRNASLLTSAYHFHDYIQLHRGRLDKRPQLLP